nr:hypothetical protein [uncultured Dongia sp.]
MPRKRNNSTSPANDGELSATGAATGAVTGFARAVPMTTSPAFDLWLERQMKTLMAACDHTPDQKLIDLIHREMGKRDGKITE